MRWLYSCPSCGRVYAIEPGRYLCDSCGAGNRPGLPLEGVLECVWENDTGKSHEIAEAGSIPLPVES